MRKLMVASLLATSVMVGPQVAMAQDSESAALRAEMEAMRAQMAQMQDRLEALDTSANEITVTNPADPGATAAAAPAPATPSKPATNVTWRGAPQISTDDGWRFKPRGRIQLDFAGVSTPRGVTEERGGFGTEFRRVYLGVDGAMPGGFGYRVEADIAEGITLTDVYMNYGKGPLKITVGQVKSFWGLDEMTSDLFISFLERSTISQAFGFERRVGLSAEYEKNDFLLQGGIFAANANDLLDDTNKAFSADARAIWAPKIGERGQLHLGGSVHLRNLNDPNGTVRYRARPGAHTTDLRLVDTGAIWADGERSFGLEGAYLFGPFHAAAEGYWQSVKRVDGANPTFFGVYGEVGMVLTKGDKRGYKSGVFDRLSPTNPVSRGGIGAVEVNARYDYLDLNDQDIVGGRQKAAWLSVVWAPIDYVRLTANYGKLWIRDARVPTATGSRNYSGDTFGLRTQLDF